MEIPISAIKKVVKVTMKNGVKTEVELSEKELEQWKKDHIIPTEASDNDNTGI